MASPHVRSSPTLQPKADADFAAACIEEALARLCADRAHRAELAEAEDEVTGLVDEGLTWRLTRAAESIQAAARGPKEQSTETILAPNGVQMDREELEQARRRWDSIDFTRDRGRPG
jgi:DNA primase